MTSGRQVATRSRSPINQQLVFVVNIVDMLLSVSDGSKHCRQSVVDEGFMSYRVDDGVRRNAGHFAGSQRLHGRRLLWIRLRSAASVTTLDRL